MNVSTYLFSAIFALFIALISNEDHLFDTRKSIQRHISLTVSQEVAETDEKGHTVNLDSQINDLVNSSLQHLKSHSPAEFWSIIESQTGEIQDGVLNQVVSQLMAENHYASLREVFEHVDESTRIKRQIQFHYARTLNKVGAKQDAITAYLALLEAIPSHQSAAINLGILLNREKQYQRTIDILTPTLSLSAGKKKAKILSLIGTSHKALRQWKMAEKRLIASINYRPSHSATWLNLAQVQQARGMPYTEVKQTYQRAVALAPDDFTPQFELGNFALEFADYGSAIKHLKQASNLNPKHMKSRQAFAWALFEANQWEASLTHWRWLEKHGTRKSYRLTAKYMKTIINGEENQLRPMYRSQREKRYVEALSLAQQQHWKESITTLDGISPDNPFYLRSLLRKATLYRQLGEDDKADEINELIKPIQLTYDDSAALPSRPTCPRAELCIAFN